MCKRRFYVLRGMGAKTGQWVESFDSERSLCWYTAFYDNAYVFSCKQDAFKVWLSLRDDLYIGIIEL